ncbi:hypothetical protein RvY_03424 [Ramazzottius varieornatus]|uniref:Uncharacterized protein n=1 Tax=Ramazzottius varieornatus TaxID=947166 RepID=A0A1D1URT0_RAMVA|nr:hypothetical protein RvY_03424 [Ramazzottius varieornatus]
MSPFRQPSTAPYAQLSSSPTFRLVQAHRYDVLAEEMSSAASHHLRRLARRRHRHDRSDGRRHIGSFLRHQIRSGRMAKDVLGLGGDEGESHSTLCSPRANKPVNDVILVEFIKS